ncbi:hypothetical protein F5877DRAFT_85510 [Lentinula edodes]|nr:hypothetical protein F5877DRAFT_85510 [Lentinula edodes]
MIETIPTSLVSTTCIASLPVTQIEENPAIKFDSLLLPQGPTSEHSLSDFGLAKRGARILPALTSTTEGLGSLSYLDGLIAIFRGYDKTQMHINPPRVVLEEQLSVSDCWKFAGSKGHIAIALLDTIFWKSFTVHFPHYPEIMEMRLREAPKEIVMWALVLTENIEDFGRSLQTDWEHFVTNSKQLDSSIFNASTALMEVARVVYKPTEGSHQIFFTRYPVRTSVILVEILDNWGDSSTCLHWLSFHD